MAKPLMTHDELLEKAIVYLRSVEARRKDAPECLRRIAVDQLPKRRVRDAVVVYFESEEVGGGRIQAFLDRDSGDVISASYIGAKDDAE